MLGKLDCFVEGIKYLGALVHPKIDNVTSATDCQVHCQNIDACTVFLYWVNLQSCRLKASSATEADLTAISGPKYC